MSPIRWNNFPIFKACIINIYLKIPRCLYKAGLYAEAIFKSQKLPGEKLSNRARKLESRVETLEAFLGHL